MAYSRDLGYRAVWLAIVKGNEQQEETAGGDQLEPMHRERVIIA